MNIATINTAYRAFVEVVGDVDPDLHEIEVDVNMPVRRFTSDWDGTFALYFTRAQVVELITALAQTLADDKTKEG